MTATSIYHTQISTDERRAARRQYTGHRWGAQKRNIEFLLSFDEWLDIWLSSGHWHERGRKRGQYCMSRFGDVGAYAVDNVFIQLHANNVSDSNSRPSWQQTQVVKNRKLAANPTWRAKQRAAVQRANKKPFHTPLGNFESVTAAIAASGFGKDKFRALAKLNPEDYYFLPRS